MNITDHYGHTVTIDGMTGEWRCETCELVLPPTAPGTGEALSEMLRCSCENCSDRPEPMEPCS